MNKFRYNSFSEMAQLPEMFDENNIYLQWLERRGPGSERRNRYTMHIIWGMTIVNIILYPIATTISSNFQNQSNFDIVMIVITGCLSVLILGALPVLFILYDLLQNPSKAIDTDINRNLLQWVFLSPIPTSTIVGALRRWTLKNNLVHLAPSVLMGAVMFITILATNGYGYRSIPVFALQTINILFIGIFIWLLLYSVGIAFASMTQWLRIPVFFILAVWFIMFFGFIYSWGQNLGDWFFGVLYRSWIERNVHPMLVNDIYDGFVRFFNSLSLLIPIIVFWFLQVPLMNLRRRHMWK